MTLNPIHDYSTQQLISKYRVRVTLVYDWGRDCNFAEFHTIKSYCKNNGMIFGGREFNSYHHLEDREYIVKLPAFHVSVQDEYERTLYPGPDIFKEFQAIILGIKIQEAAYQKNKHKSFWSFLRSLLPKKRTVQETPKRRKSFLENLKGI
jgi:hypothetical protein